MKELKVLIQMNSFFLFVYSQAKYFEEQMATLFGSAGVDELPTPEQFNVGFQKMAGNC